MAQVGRPRELDKSKRREICALITASCGPEWASHYAGVSARTIRREVLRARRFPEHIGHVNLPADNIPLANPEVFSNSQPAVVDAPHHYPFNNAPLKTKLTTFCQVIKPPAINVLRTVRISRACPELVEGTKPPNFAGRIGTPANRAKTPPPTFPTPHSPFSLPSFIV